MLESWHEPSSQEAGAQCSRRTMLAGSVGLVLASVADAAGSIDAATVERDVAAHQPMVVLQDRRMLLPDDARLRLEAQGMHVLTLEADPVRMWRGTHAALLDSPRTRLLGVTPWIEFVMVRGLAAESRRRVRHQRFDARRDAMVWVIA